jgi:hypothetical protein
MNKREGKKLAYIKSVSAHAHTHFNTRCRTVCGRFVKQLGKISQQFDAAW